MLKNEKGIALILTLLIITILVVSILDFSHTMQIDITMTGNFRDGVKAYYNAKSGINFAIALLKEDAENTEDTEEPSDDLTEKWAKSCYMPPLAIDDGVMSVCIVDENRKININGINENFKSENRLKALQRIIASLLDIDKDDDTIINIINNIRDWIDPNDESRTAENAEQSYYESLDPPYPCKNGPLDTISEFRLIKGIIEVVKENEKIKDVQELMEYLTVYPNVNEAGKININTASRRVLESLCYEPEMVDVNEIIGHQEEEPFENISQIKDFIGCYNEIVDMIAVRSDYYSVDAKGEVNGIRKRILAVLKKDTDKIKIIYWKVE
ncbi:MAG: type II secretion system minor pseudopilin GspK [Nitrospinota bacterium]